MNDRKVRRWTGAFGVAAFVVFLIALPLYFVSAEPVPRPEDTARFSDFVTRIHTLILVRTSLADPLIMVGFLVFLAGFRHLVRQARQDYEWVGTLVFGVGLALTAVFLVGDGLEASAALDTIGGTAEPAAVRALWEGSIVAFGAIGLIMAALFLASAGYAVSATRALPRWTGWLAGVAAILNLVAAPAIYGGTDATGFYTADGLAAFIGLLPLLIWLLIVSITMIMKRGARVPTTAHQDTAEPRVRFTATR